MEPKGAQPVRPEKLRWGHGGLIPVILQDADTREVLTLAYMNRDALRRSLAEGQVWLWSRSRQMLWHKGETSGNVQDIQEIRVDCDTDALLLLVHPHGPACHTGRTSCFYRALQRPSAQEELT